MTAAKCPKCGSRNFRIVDYFIAGCIFEVVGGVVYPDGADGGGSHIKTNCTCRKCGYEWHPRNFTYVIDEHD